MAGRATESHVDDKEQNQQSCPSAWMTRWASRSSKTITRVEINNSNNNNNNNNYNNNKTNDSHIPRFVKQPGVGVIDTIMHKIVEENTKTSGNGDGISRENISVAMQKGKSVESSSLFSRTTFMEKYTIDKRTTNISLDTTTTKTVNMESSSKLPHWMNVASSRKFESLRDDIDLELALQCSASSSKPKPNMIINLDDIDDGPTGDQETNAKRLKLIDSSTGSYVQPTTKNEEKTTKSFYPIPEPILEQVSNKRGSKESMPIVIDESDDEADLPKSKEVTEPPEEKVHSLPRVAAMATLGRVLMNDPQIPFDLEKRGALTLWKS